MDEQRGSNSFMNRDVKVFEEIFKAHSRELYFMAMGLCNDRELAQDAVQESFVYLWNHRERVDMDGSVVAYLRASVRNYILNYIRHQKVRADKEEEIVREQEFLNEEEDELTAKIEMVRLMIDSLPENCRKIFILSVVEGLSYADTASALDVSVNTVKTQVKIGYKKIKGNIQGDSDEILFALLFLLSLK